MPPALSENCATRRTVTARPKPPPPAQSDR
jgi:hypothetical protein